MFLVDAFSPLSALISLSSLSLSLLLTLFILPTDNSITFVVSLCRFYIFGAAANSCSLKVTAVGVALKKRGGEQNGDIFGRRRRSYTTDIKKAR